MRPILIYIAGPYRAPDAWRINRNVHRAECVATLVWEAGHYALCPHANTRHGSGNVTDDQYLAGTMEMMRRCDAVLVLQNSTDSAGTRDEIIEAQALGIPVQHLSGISAFEVRRCVELLARRLAA